MKTQQEKINDARNDIDTAITKWLEFNNVPFSKIDELDYSEVDDALNNLLDEAQA